jgi:allantoicase
MNDEPFDRVPGGRIIACSDEGFAPAENLLATRAPEFRFGVFIPGKGQEFDSWETRRHNPHAPDWAVVALGTPGPIGTVDVDTHWHDGNHAERGAVFALRGDPNESPAHDDPRWVELLPATALDGHAHNVFRTPRGLSETWTHVRLENHPDGGIARLRCYANRAPTEVDPGDADARRVRHEAAIPRGGDTAHHGPTADDVAARWREVSADARVNLASEGLGAKVVATSNNRYGHSQQLLADAAPKSMGDGWETSRSRGAGHFDYVVVALGREGTLDALVVDFTYFVLNNPVALRVLGARSTADGVPDDAWVEVLAHTPVKHLAGARLTVETSALKARGPFTHLRLETSPDGGANRLVALGRAV